MCYTYDDLGRVTHRVVKDMCDVVLSDEAYTYDAAGNVTDAPNSCFLYDTNNRLWTKSGTVWTSLYSSYYTVANPARYIDSTNRVWEMRNGGISGRTAQQFVNHLLGQCK